MERFAICNETYQGWDWAAACGHAGETGYNGIEVAPFTLADDVRSLSSHARNVLSATARRSGLAVTGLHWLLVSPKGLSCTGSAEARAATAAYLEALVDFCRDLGGDIMVLGSPAQRRIPPGGCRESAEESLLETLSPALRRCETQRVTICLEALPPPEADLVLTMADAARLVKRADHPALAVMLDVKSASSEGPDIAALASSYGRQIRHVHANDANRRGPGFGDTDFRPLIRALDADGYAGWISVEVFDYSPSPQVIARESLEYLRACSRTAGPE